MADIKTYIENLRKSVKPEPVNPELVNKAEAWDELTEGTSNE